MADSRREGLDTCEEVVCTYVSPVSPLQDATLHAMTLHYTTLSRAQFLQVRETARRPQSR